MMLIDRLTLNLIALIDERGTISAAARELGLSASLATRKLAAAEDVLGTRLFVRSSRSTHATDAGRLVAGWARQTLSGEASMREELAALRHEISGPIRFSCPEFLLSSLLVDWIADFLERYPKVKLSMLSSDRRVQVAEERYDITLHMGSEPAPNLYGRRLSDLEMGLYASHAYVARHGVPQTPDELARHRMVRHTLLNDKALHLVNGAGHRATVALDQSIETSSAVLAIELLLAGSGIISVGRRTMRLPRFAPQVVDVLPDYESVLPDGSRYAVWLLFPDRRLPPRVRVFADELTDFMRTLFPR